MRKQDIGTFMHPVKSSSLQSQQKLGCCLSLIIFEPRHEKTGLRGFPTRSHTNQAVLPQKMARGL